MHDVVVITYWWGNGFCKNTKRDYFRQNMHSPMLTYPQLVKRLGNQAKRHGFLFDSEELLGSPKYQEAISYKAVFIQKMLDKWKKPVLYVDCDMYIHKPPIMFTTNQYDFMAFNWNADMRVYKALSSIVFDWRVLETSGGIFYFNHTSNALRLLNAWASELRAQPHKADDRLLAIAFVKTDAKKWLRYYWIPMEYFYVPQYYYKTIPHKQVIISHPYALTNEDVAQSLAGTRSRIPSLYTSLVEKQVHHTPFIVEYQSNKTIQTSIYHRNRHLHSLPNMTYMLNPPASLYSSDAVFVIRQPLLKNNLLSN